MSAAMTENGRVLEALLQGQFICAVSDEDAFSYLGLEANRATINHQLAPLNRRLASACDGEVYFCAYEVLGDDEHRVLSSQFQEIATHLHPLVEWLLLAQEAQGSDAPLSAGDPLRLNELQSVIEDTPALREQLAKVAQYRLFGSTSNSVDGQLKQVFKRLVEHGYFIRPNPERLIYTATAKLDYLYELLRFIDEAEDLALEQHAMDALNQQETLL
ncbi:MULTISPECIES: hypothetical protein [Aliagarivorans]|uniref:hypothetical protein n=1 Tax=Aliagarivorans TaxID=882379 RepID=UPI0003F9F00C|nr:MULTISPECIES: hypothetical protein [Aliagarivorans]